MSKKMVEGRADSSPVKPTMNYEQAKSLFDAESVFFGVSSGVPLSRVAELLGDKPAKYASELWGGGAGRYVNCYFANGYKCEYLTCEGFLRAIGYANVLILAQAEGYYGQTD